METQSIAKNLVYQRKLKGYTQEQLSEKTQVTVRTIQRIEKGEVNPQLQTVKLLATALDIEVDDLLVLENPKEESLQEKWLLLIHGTPLLGSVLPLCNILFPLFLWIHKREDNRVYDVHGVKVVNFQISVTLLYIISFVALLTVEKWGFIFFLAMIPFNIVVILYNLMKVVNTRKCYYPLSFPFVKAGQSASSAKGLSLVMVSFLLLGSCAPPAVERLDGSAITHDSLTAKVKQLMEVAHVPGLAITVFDDHEVAYQQCFGYRNAEDKRLLNDSTNVYGGSFSKAVFGVLVMKLVEDGVIDLDTPLESYLPQKIYEYPPLTRWHDDYSALRNDSLYHRITARMCLMHTTGFPNWRWFEPDQQLRIKHEPGSRYSYSGEGLVYLQVVLEKMLGKHLEELAQEIIFVPLGMRRSSYRWLPEFENNFAFGYSASGERFDKDIDNEPRSASTLETTPEDYTQFLQAVLAQKIIEKESWNELFRPQIRLRSVRQFGPLAQQDSTLNDDIALSYGLGWGILQSPYGKGVFKECHGEGFQHYSILFPEAGKGIMLMTNSDNGESIFKELLEVAIQDIYTPWEWENYVPYDQRES